jgi:ABC-type Fe3+-siderophore transport system permease subunit
MVLIMMAVASWLTYTVEHHGWNPLALVLGGVAIGGFFYMA